MAATNPHLPMRLQISTRVVGHVSVIGLAGQLVMGNETLALADHVQQLVNSDQNRLVIVVEQLTFIDSSGVGELVAVFSAAKQAGGSMKIARPSEMVRRVLEISHINQLLEVYDDEHEAIASYADE